MLETTLQLGDAVEHRGVVLAPLFPRRSPVADYATLEDALPLGLRIDEVSESGSVPQLAVSNPTDANVLLYDGEELLGAKQNRILNVTVLVPAQSTTPIPVSCVEEGRWSRRSRASRRRRTRRTRSCAGARRTCSPPSRSRSGSPRARSGTRCAPKSARLDVDSPTGAQATSSARGRTSCPSSSGRSRSSRGQCGALLALGDVLCLDYVAGGFRKLDKRCCRGFG